MLTDCPTPTPPVTIKAPVVDEEENVELVIANPDTLKISVLGLYTKVPLADTAEPDVFMLGVNNTGCIDDEFVFTILRLFDVVAEPTDNKLCGIYCGAVLVPLDVRT